MGYQNVNGNQVKLSSGSSTRIYPTLPKGPMGRNAQRLRDIEEQKEAIRLLEMKREKIKKLKVNPDAIKRSLKKIESHIQYHKDYIGRLKKLK